MTPSDSSLPSQQRGKDQSVTPRSTGTSNAMDIIPLPKNTLAAPPALLPRLPTFPPIRPSYPPGQSRISLTCPIMVLASTSALLGPLSMSAAFRKIWARSWTGFRSHSFLAAKAALMALLMSSCRRKGERQQGGTQHLSVTRSEGKVSGHPPPGNATAATFPSQPQICSSWYQFVPGTEQQLAFHPDFSPASVVTPLRDNAC